MTTRWKPILAVIMMLGATLMPLDVHAQSKSKQNIDKAQAAQNAQKKVKGRVLKVEQNRNKSKYRVKVLQNSGRVVSVDVDKKSGKVSKSNKKKEK